MTDKLRRLQVNLDDIADAMEYRDPMMMLHSYLDTETGEVITVSSEELSIVEGIYQTHDQEEHDKPLDLAAILAKSDYPQWQIEIILEAERVEMGYGTRYISLPEQDSREGYSDMEAFIPTVDDQRLQNLLWRAIEGRGAFRRFKDVLERERRTRERWFTFQGERRRERAHHWLESEGIEAIHIPRSLPEDVPAQPDPRQRLLEEVLIFTTAARQLTGVTRIALIGSLTTDEPDPDDADMLVTVADDMNLEALAALGRNYQGMHNLLIAAVRSFWPIRKATIWAAPALGSAVGQGFAWLVKPNIAGNVIIFTMTCKIYV